MRMIRLFTVLLMLAALAYSAAGPTVTAQDKTWLLKEKILPPVYWQAMLRGREWLAKPGAVKPDVVS